MPKLWEYLHEPYNGIPPDTMKSFEAFIEYRDMPSNKRSLETLAQTLNKSKAWLGVWSSKHCWVERVAAYDSHMAEYSARVKLQNSEYAREEHRNYRRHIMDGALTLYKRRVDKLMAQNRDNPPSVEELTKLATALKNLMYESRAEFNDLPTQKIDLDIEILLVEQVIHAVKSIGGNPADVFQRIIEHAALTRGDSE